MRYDSFDLTDAGTIGNGISGETLYRMGCCLETGNGVEKNPAQAVNCYREAADRGYMAAALADSFRLGLGVEENANMAFGLYTAAAQAGSVEGMYALGQCYLEGEGTVKDPKQAVKWLELAAEQGNPCAMFLLGVCLAEGLGVAESMAAAEDWIRKAAAKDGRFGVVAKAIERCDRIWDDLCSEQVAQELMEWTEWSGTGKTLCRRLLACLYQHGWGVAKDGETAEKLLILAAEDGSVPAMRTLAENRQYGFGVEKDLELARQWYERAVQQEDTTAMRLLAELYIQGINGEPEPDMAVCLYESAAEQGDAEAAYLLAGYYLAGSLPCDPENVREKVQTLLLRAARLGHGDAAVRLTQFF